MLDSSPRTTLAIEALTPQSFAPYGDVISARPESQQFTGTVLTKVGKLGMPSKLAISRPDKILPLDYPAHSPQPDTSTSSRL